MHGSLPKATSSIIGGIGTPDLKETSFSKDQLDKARDIDDPGEPPAQTENIGKLTKAYQQLIRAEARAEVWGARLRRFLDQGCTCGERGVCAFCQDRKENAPGEPKPSNPFGRSNP